VSDLQQTAITLAAVKVIGERLSDVERAGKATVKESAGVGARVVAILPDGTEGATISVSRPTSTPARPGGEPYVANPALFTEWAERVDPDSIVKSVRTTDVPRLLALALEGLQMVGELPPGIELTDPTPASTSGGGSVSVRQSPAQAENTLRALVGGAIPLPSLAPQIEGGDTGGGQE
jgi:hypothetical protein